MKKTSDTIDLLDALADLNGSSDAPEETKKMIITNLATYIQPNSSNKAVLVDAWGNGMRYTSKSVGDQPALISAGPDGKFGNKVKNETGGAVDTTVDADSDDNIRSDKGL